MKRDKRATFNYSEDDFFFQFPAQENEGGGIAATGGYKEFQVAHRMNLTIVNAGAGVATVKWWDDHDHPKTFTVSAGAPLAITNQLAHALQISGANINVAGAASWPDQINPNEISIPQAITVGSVSGTVSVVGNVNASGSVVTVASQGYVGGVPAPVSGIWTFRAKVTTNGAYLLVDNGGGAKPVVPNDGTQASNMVNTDEHDYTYPVTQGVTYTITGGTLVDGQIN